MILAIDIGGTFIKYALVEKEIILKDKVATPNGKMIKNKILELYKALSEYPIIGIAISSAGQIDSSKGEVIFAGPTIPDYSGEKLREFLEDQTKLNITVINDVSAAALALSTDHGLFISLGTGIGGAFINDSKLYQGKHFGELEIGHTILNGSSFESQCSASALCKKFSENFNEDMSGEMIEKLFLAKDTQALELLDEYFDLLGIGILNILYVLDPKTIYLGGGISEATFFDTKKILAAIQRYAICKLDIKIEKIKIGNDAALIGACNYYRSEND